MNGQDQFFFGGENTAPVTKNAAYFRKQARDKLRGHWGIAIVVLLLASILGAFSTNISFGTNRVTISENEVTEAEAETGITDPDIQAIVHAILTGDRSGLTEEQDKLFATVTTVLTVVVCFVLGILLLYRLLLGSPVAIGYEKFNLNLIDGAELKVGTLFDYFHLAYGRSVLLRILRTLIDLLCALPSILAVIYFAVSCLMAGTGTELSFTEAAGMLSAGLAMIVGGIVTIILSVVVAYRYAFAMTILAEYPETGAADAMRQSASLMKGNKWRLFCLDISFFGWYLLGTLACGIGVLAVTPYHNAARTAFYDEIANRAAARDAEFPSINPDDYSAF